MAKIYAGSDNYILSGTTKTLNTGKGKVLSVLIASYNGPATFVFFDNTAASGSILFTLVLDQYQTLQINFNPLFPPVFAIGLTVAISALGYCHVVTEA